MIKRKDGLCLHDDREYILAEHNAHEELIKQGYTPQGSTKDFKKVVVFKIENEHKNNEKKDIFYFNDWQEALEILGNQDKNKGEFELYLIDLLEKSLKGTLEKEEAPKLIHMLEGEIQLIKDMFEMETYIVTIKNTNGHETGIASETIDIVCRKKNGTYRNIRTDEAYDSSILSVKKIN